MSAAPLCQPVSWLTPEQQRVPHAGLLNVISDARDVVGGAAEVFALVLREDLDADFADDDGQPLPLLMSASMRSELVRMSAASLRLLVDRLGEALQADAQRPAAVARAAQQFASALVDLIPRAPCAGMMLSAEEAASLTQLRDLLQGREIQS